MLRDWQCKMGSLLVQSMQTGVHFVMLTVLVLEQSASMMVVGRSVTCCVLASLLNKHFPAGNGNDMIGNGQCSPM